ncbi:response regulator transcription factor [Pollutimonas harenae]|uniref:Response regulator transcription factor n=1 Tax=Pollutimonas harenae TaxID=657015 RepID=A0A853GPM6_9BURK|nr:response regulator transcription factor [Pollutimonas harenae]NYT84117.1 response regulator transcription factor [Pollutimonas harenae]TEA73461.1 response regulator transcription factor [Pollutimonas harenae]
MKQDLNILFFVPRARAGTVPDRMERVRGLQESGFQVQRCTTIPMLHKCLQASASGGMPPVVILAGTLLENCSATTYLRALHPSMGIVAMVGPRQDAEVIRLLQSGVDNHFVHTASNELLAAILFRLLARSDSGPASAESVSSVTKGNWSLKDQAWRLISPDGVEIALTTGERAFLSVLFHAPDRRATHSQLADAVDQDYALASARKPQGRLGVLVSRMRQKCSRLGAPLPLKSLHNWGYMFTGPV